MTERALRRSTIDHCRGMNARGLNQGTAGNISLRHGDTMLITPSGIPYDAMKPKHIAAMPIAGDYGAWSGPLRPSVEWRIHLDILRARPETGAVVHAHSPYATALAMARKDIPPCHYMIALFGGPDIRCAGHAKYGTPELSALALQALRDRQGCLLANHGMVALGANLNRAMALAVELETVARQYFNTLLIGGPVLLSPAEIEDARRDFGGYGKQDATGAANKRLV